MKRLLLILAAVVLLISGVTVVLVCCLKDKIVSIEVVTESIPTDLSTYNAKDRIGEIKLLVNYKRKKAETISLETSMLSTEDINKFSTEGTHTIKVNYEGLTTEFQVIVKGDPEYLFYVEDIAGKPLSDFYVEFYLGTECLAEGYTGTNGTFKAVLKPNKYEVYVEAKEGYYLDEDHYTTDLIGTPIMVEAEIDPLRDVEAPVENRYELGDLMYDFTLTDLDGQELKLYNLLDKYKAVILNFWYVDCTYCQQEFPFMIEAYNSTYTDSEGNTHNYSDDIVIIAINNGIAGGGDTKYDIEQYRDSLNINFNVAMDYDLDPDVLGMDPALTTMFNILAYPTTVVIDKYGLIAEIGEGGVPDKDKWTQLFDTYIDPGYNPEYKGSVEEGPVIVKPNVTQEDSSVLEAAVNGTNYDGTKYSGGWNPETGSDAEYSWPWQVVEKDGKKALAPTNKGYNSSYAIVYTTVSLKAGEAFVFDYYSSSEKYDGLYLIADGSLLSTISGVENTWKKNYAYVAIEDGEYEFAFCYLKDSSYESGEDLVYISNVHIEDSSTIDQETYIYRECAYGDMNEFTMSYSKYTTVVYNEVDGYYHVNNVNGPLLFADMIGETLWNNSSLYSISEEGLCIGTDNVDYNEIIKEYSIYASCASNGYTPVTEELANALKQVTNALGDVAAKDNQDQWLEVCLYFSAYGTGGKELGISTEGVCYFEAIEFAGDGLTEPATAVADYNRIILPRGMIFSFTPTQSGVYRYYSNEQDETIGWICDEKGIVIDEEEMGLREYAILASKGESPDMNFNCYIYLEAGKEYLFRACFYDIYLFKTISVSMEYVDDSLELFTIASPGFFTSSDDEMSDIISGNYVDVELGTDGYYQVIDSKAEDKHVYLDCVYLTNVLGNQTILQSLEPPFNAFNFALDEYGYPIYDEEGYFRYTQLNEELQVVNYYVYIDANEEGGYGYSETILPDKEYVKLTPEEIAENVGLDCTEIVRQYIEDNMITDTESTLYGCVKVDEALAKILELLMDKYLFYGVEYSWLKLCYYFEYLGA